MVLDDLVVPVFGFLGLAAELQRDRDLLRSVGRIFRFRIGEHPFFELGQPRLLNLLSLFVRGLLHPFAVLAHHDPVVDVRNQRRFRIQLGHVLGNRLQHRDPLGIGRKLHRRRDRVDLLANPLLVVIRLGDDCIEKLQSRLRELTHVRFTRVRGRSLFIKFPQPIDQFLNFGRNPGGTIGHGTSRCSSDHGRFHQQARLRDGDRVAFQRSRQTRHLPDIADAHQLANLNQPRLATDIDNRHHVFVDEQILGRAQLISRNDTRSRAIEPHPARFRGDDFRPGNRLFQLSSRIGHRFQNLGLHALFDPERPEVRRRNQ